MAKTAIKKLIDEIDHLDSDIALIKAGFTCMMCGKVANQIHHYFPKGGHGNVRFDPDNHCPICFGCHHIRIGKAGEAEEIRDRLINKIGEENFNALKARAHIRAERKEYYLRRMLKYKQFVLVRVAEECSGVVKCMTGAAEKRLAKAKKSFQKGELDMFKGIVNLEGDCDDY